MIQPRYDPTPTIFFTLYTLFKHHLPLHLSSALASLSSSYSARTVKYRTNAHPWHYIIFSKVILQHFGHQTNVYLFFCNIAWICISTGRENSELLMNYQAELISIASSQNFPSYLWFSVAQTHPFFCAYILHVILRRKAPLTRELRECIDRFTRSRAFLGNTGVL